MSTEPAAAQGQWAVANLCGEHTLIASGSGLADAEREALNREITLKQLYAADLPPCKRVVTVDPTGAVVSRDQEYSTTWGTNPNYSGAKVR